VTPFVSRFRPWYNKTNKKQVTWHETQCGDNQVASRDLKQPVPRVVTFAVKVDLLQDDGLVEVDAIKAARAPFAVSPMVPKIRIEVTYATSTRNQHIAVPISVLKCLHSLI